MMKYHSVCELNSSVTIYASSESKARYDTTFVYQVMCLKKYVF